MDDYEQIRALVADLRHVGADPGLAQYLFGRGWRIPTPDIHEKPQHVELHFVNLPKPIAAVEESERKGVVNLANHRRFTNRYLK